MNKVNEYFFRPLFIGLIFFSLSFIIIDNFKFFKIINLKIQDINHKINYHILHSKPKIGNNAVLILIDPKTDREIGYRFPFPRELIAEVIDNVHKHKPKLFAMDFTLMGFSSGENDDVKLSNSLKNNNIILFTFIQDDGLIYKIPDIFRKSVQDIGIISKNLDIDNVIRSITPFACDIKTFENIYPAELVLALNFFGLNGSLIHQDVINNILKINIYPSPLKPINYGSDKRIEFKNYYKLKDLNVISFFDVLKGNIPDNLFKDKIVLLGQLSEIYHDQHITPLGIELGVVLVYNSLLTFLNNEFLSPLSFFFKYFSYFLVIFIYVLFSIKITPKNLIFFTVFYISLLIIIGFVFFKSNYIWQSFIPIFAIFLNLIYNILKEYIRIWNLNNKIKNSIILDSKTGFYSFPYFLSKFNSDITNNSKFLIAALKIDKIEKQKNINNLQLKKNLITVGNILKFVLKKNEYFCWHKDSSLFFFILKNIDLKSLEKIKNYKFIELFKSKFIENGFDFNVAYISPSHLENPKVYTILETLKVYHNSKTSELNQFIYLSSSYYEKNSENILDTSKNYEVLNNDNFLSDQIMLYQENLSSLQDKLKITSKEIEISRKLSSVGKIAAEVAHELKNPLQNLLYMCEFLNRFIEKDHNAYKYLEILKKETDRMTKLCHSMLDFSRVKESISTKINVNEIISETLDFMSGTFRKKHINIITNFDKKIVLINGDKDKLKQVFLNLFINSVDAMNDAGELYVETIYELNLIQIIIKDNGIGIPKENLDKIFDIFFTTKGDKGNGLGLSTCFNIIKNHKGKINVESEVGFGTTFTIIFST